MPTPLGKKIGAESSARPVFTVNFFLPLLNGVMHLQPALGASWVAAGRRELVGGHCLALLFALHVLIDGQCSASYTKVPNL